MRKLLQQPRITQLLFPTGKSMTALRSLCLMALLLMPAMVAQAQSDSTSVTGDSLYIPPADTLNISAYIIANDPAISSMSQINTNGAVDVQDINEKGWVYGSYNLPGGGERLFIITMDTLNRPTGLHIAGDYDGVIPVGMSGNKIAYNRDFGGNYSGFVREFDEVSQTFGPEQYGGRYLDFSSLSAIAGNVTGSNSYMFPERPDYNDIGNFAPEIGAYWVPILGPINFGGYLVPENYYRGFVKDMETGDSRPVAFPMALIYNRYSEVNDVSSDGTAVGASRGKAAGNMWEMYPTLHNYVPELQTYSTGYLLNGESGYATAMNAYEEVVGIYQPPGNPSEQAFFIGVNCQDPITENYNFDIILPNRFITTPDVNDNALVVGTFLYNGDNTSGFENRAYAYQHCDCGEGDFFNMDEIVNGEYPALDWTLRVGRAVNNQNFAVGRGVDANGDWFAWRVKIPKCFFCLVENDTLSHYILKDYPIGNEAFQGEGVEQITITDLETGDETVYTGGALAALIAENEYYFENTHQYKIEIFYSCGGVDKSKILIIDVFHSYIPRPNTTDVSKLGNRPAIPKGDFDDIPEALQAPRFYAPAEGYDLLIIQQERAYSNLLLKRDTEETLPYFVNNGYALADDGEIFSDIVVREIERWNQDNPGREIRYQVMTNMQLMDSEHFFTWVEKFSAVWVNFEGMNKEGFAKYKQHHEEWKDYALNNTVIATMGQHMFGYQNDYEIDSYLRLLPYEIQVREEQHSADIVYNIWSGLQSDNKDPNHWSMNGITQELVVPWQEAVVWAQDRDPDLNSWEEARDTVEANVMRFFDAFDMQFKPNNPSNSKFWFRASTLSTHFFDPDTKAGLRYDSGYYSTTVPAQVQMDDAILDGPNYPVGPPDVNFVNSNSIFFMEENTMASYRGYVNEGVIAINGLLWGTANNMMFEDQPTMSHAKLLRNLVNWYGEVQDTNFIVSPVRVFTFHAKDKPHFKTSLSPAEEANVEWSYRNNDHEDWQPIDPATFRFDPQIDYGLIKFRAVYNGKEDIVWGNVANWGLYTYTPDGKKHLYVKEDGEQQPGINTETGKVLLLVHGWQPGAMAARNGTIGELDENMTKYEPGVTLPLINRWLDSGYTVLEANWQQIADDHWLPHVERNIWGNNQTFFQGPMDIDITQYDLRTDGLPWKHQVDYPQVMPSLVGINVFPDEVSDSISVPDFLSRELHDFFEEEYSDAYPLSEMRLMGASLGSQVSTRILSYLLQQDSAYYVERIDDDCVLKRIDYADMFFSSQYDTLMRNHIADLTLNHNTVITNYKSTIFKDLSDGLQYFCSVLFGPNNVEQDVCLLKTAQLLISRGKSFKKLAKKPTTNFEKFNFVKGWYSQVTNSYKGIFNVIESFQAQDSIRKLITEVDLDIRWVDNIPILNLPNPEAQHGGAWAQYLHSLSEDEPELYAPVEIPNFDVALPPTLIPDDDPLPFPGFNARTCQDYVKRFRGIAVEQLDGLSGSGTITTSDDKWMFSSVINFQKFDSTGWQSYQCGQQEVVLIEMDDILNYPVPDTLIQNRGIQFVVNDAEYSPTAVTISYGRPNKEDNGKMNWYPVEDKDLFWFDYVYFDGWELDQPDSMYVPYGEWRLQALYNCPAENKLIKQEFNVESLDWGIYFKDADGKLVKHIQGAENPNFDPDKNTVIYSHGYQGGSVDKRYIDDLNWEGLNLTENFSALDYNVGVFNWTQFADDTSVPNSQAKIHTTFPDGMPYRTWGDNSIQTDGSVADSSVAMLFAAQVDRIMEDWDFETQELRLVGHSLGSQVVTNGAFEMEGEHPSRIALLDAFWTTSRLPDMLSYIDTLEMYNDLEQKTYDAENKSYTAFEWIAATNFDELGEVDVPGFGKQFENRPVKEKVAFLRIQPDFLTTEFGFAGIGLPFADFLGANYLINPASSHYAPVVWYFSNFGNTIPDEYYQDDRVLSGVGYDNLYIGEPGDEGYPYYDIVTLDGEKYEREQNYSVSANLCTDDIKQKPGLILRQIEGGNTLSSDDDIHLLEEILEIQLDWNQIIEN